MDRKSASLALPQIKQSAAMRMGRRAYLRWMLLVLVCGILMFDATPAPPSDLRPVQLAADYYFPPSPIIQYGKPRLVYELRLLNYIPTTYVLD